MDCSVEMVDESDGDVAGYESGVEVEGGRSDDETGWCCAEEASAGVLHVTRASMVAGS